MCYMAAGLQDVPHASRFSDLPAARLFVLLDRQVLCSTVTNVPTVWVTMSKPHALADRHTICLPPCQKISDVWKLNVSASASQQAVMRSRATVPGEPPKQQLWKEDVHASACQQATMTSVHCAGRLVIGKRGSKPVHVSK